jgi:Zn-dependent protease with chaperone function
MPSQAHSPALIWTMSIFLVASFSLTFVPCWLVLCLGRYRRDKHWTQNARPVFTARLIVATQLLVLTAAALVFLIDLEPLLLPRIASLAAVVLGWYAASWLVGRALKRQYDFPSPVIAFEAQRYLVLHLSMWGALVLPVLTCGLPLTLRLTASILAIVGTVISIAAATKLMGLLGLLEPLPSYLTTAIRNRAPDVRSAALRTIQANAVALPFERTILFTTGALQSLTHEGLIAVAHHELSHLREGASVKFLRALPRLLALILSVTVALTPPAKAWCGFLVLFVAVFASQYVLRRVSVTKERIADRYALRHEENEGDYAHALEALHKAFLMPAVLPKRSTHPSLYDRLKSAGVVPDYPRPPAPSKTPVLWTVMVSVPLMIIIAYFVLAA